MDVWGSYTWASLKRHSYKPLTIMNIDFELIKKVLDECQSSFRSEMINEIGEFIKVDKLETYQIEGAISIFEVHEKIQIETGKKGVTGYSELLENLRKYNPSDISHQLFITGENFGYLLFADFTKPIFHGVLKFSHQKINKKVELNENNQLRGKWTNKTFYLNGKRLENKS